MSTGNMVPAEFMFPADAGGSFASLCVELNEVLTGAIPRVATCLEIIEMGGGALYLGGLRKEYLYPALRLAKLAWRKAKEGEDERNLDAIKQALEGVAICAATGSLRVGTGGTLVTCQDILKKLKLNY